MDQREWMGQLRGAVYRRDSAAVMALARHPDRPADVLQLLGSGLAVALDQGGDDARREGAACVVALRERGWVGDAELADQLGASVAGAPAPTLRPLPVDLEQLASILEGDVMSTGGALDLQTGEVWHQSTIEFAHEDGAGIDAPDFDAPERFLWVHSDGSRDGYRDMLLFIDTIEDADRADRLGIAVQGRGAFRRFKDVLGRWPDELERWYAFSDERQRGRARAWLADAGYRAVLPDRHG